MAQPARVLLLFLAAAAWRSLPLANAAGPASAIDNWLDAMVAKIPAIASYKSMPATMDYIKTTKVRGCSYSSTFATMGGHSSSSNTVKAASFQAAASTCADAIGDALSDSCNGTNVASQLSAASTTCAHALAGVFVQQVSHASSTDNARACAIGCAFANTGATAIASAAGKAILSVVGKCGAIGGWMKSGQLTTAFADITSTAFTRACTQGKGSASQQGVLFSKAVASSLSKVLVQVVAKACSCKATCNCPPLPDGLEYEDQAFSDSVGKVVSGEFAVQQTVADAAGLLCDGKSVQAATKKVLDATTQALVDGLQVMTLDSSSDGSGQACGLMFSHQAALSMAMASTQVLANAFSVNFNKSCGGAGFAGVTGLAKSSDAALWLVDRLKVSCSAGGKNLTRALVNDLMRDSPLGDAVHDALQGVLSNCQCEGRCWCGTPSDSCNPQHTCPAYLLLQAQQAAELAGADNRSSRGRRLLHGLPSLLGQ